MAHFGAFLDKSGISSGYRVYPTGLFGIIQFCGAACLFAEDVVDILEGLFKHMTGVAYRISTLQQMSGE